MQIRQIVLRAQRIGHVRDNLVLCDVCDNPASKSISVKGPVLCGPCATGEADSLDWADVIVVKFGAVQPAQPRAMNQRAKAR